MFRKIFSFLLLSFSFFIFFSCSDNEPKVISTSAYVVFDYQDEELLPESRLAVFVETSSDVRRANKLVVTSRNSSWEWYCFDPVIFSSHKRQFACYTDLIAPIDETLPKGFYDIQYVDAQDKTFDTYISVNYNNSWLEKKAGEIIEDESLNYREQIALYDSENVLQYFGNIKESMTEEKNIFTYTENTSYYRKVFIMRGENSILLMPPVFKKNLSADKEEE